MEDRMTPYGQDGKQCETRNLDVFLYDCMDLERCDSVELSTLIRSHVQQKMFSKEEEDISRHQTEYQKSLCTKKCSIQSRKQKQSNLSKEEYEHKIQILEKQKAELLDVNKQWDEQFRHMKQTYENKYKGKLTVELEKIKEENVLLRTQNHILSERSNHYEFEITRLSKTLLKAENKNKTEKTSLNSSERSTDYEDLRTEVDVLLQQIQVYEEDFKQERGDKERITKEMEELQKINQSLRFQLRINNKPDYQWYVPGQLPPDVKQKETGASLKLCHMPQ